MPRRGRPRPEDLLLDGTAAAVLGLLGLSSLYGGAADARAADPLGVVLVLLGVGAVTLTRRHPLPVLAVTLTTSLAIAELDYQQNGGGLTVLWTLYVVADRLSGRVSLPATALTLALVNVSLSTAPGGATTADRISTTVILGAGWAFGRAARARRRRHEAEDRAAVAEERAVIAREMQDLVAHDLAEVMVHVTAARRLVRRDPDAAETLMSGAEGLARGAVVEVRRILSLLGAASDGDDRRPLPGLDDLAALRRRYAEEGLPVSVHVELADAAGLGPGLLAYRTVEDVLAEAGRTHASEASVTVSDESGDLRVTVSHDGSAQGEAARGAAGLHRRAALYGGTLQRTGARGATTVVLTIPTAGTRRSAP